jgi:ubiquinone/menaquinone biosynthesis C-methylase UbiE
VYLGRLEAIVLYGVLGRLLGWSGDLLYRRIHTVALRGMSIATTDNILELEFRTGGLIRMFAAAAPQGFIAGVDPSHLMWEIARRRNDSAIRAGRVDLRVCEPMLLPWHEAHFDKAIAINGFQSWSAPLEVLRGVRRVLRPGGALIMTLRGGRNGGSAIALEALKKSGFQHGEVAGCVGSEDILMAIRAPD